jgi:hypothetical protein
MVARHTKGKGDFQVRHRLPECQPRPPVDHHAPQTVLAGKWSYGVVVIHQKMVNSLTLRNSPIPSEASAHMNKEIERI